MNVPNSKVKTQNGPLTPNPDEGHKKTSARTSKQLSPNTYDPRKQLSVTQPDNAVKV